VSLPCPACGVTPRVGASFCASCGTPLQLTQGGSTIPDRRRAQIAPERAKGGLLLGLFVYASFLIFGLIGIVLEVSIADLWIYDLASLAVTILGLAKLGGESLSHLAWPRFSLRGSAQALGALALAVISAHLLLAIWPLNESIRLLYEFEALSIERALLDFCVIAPILEELAFRGVILSALGRAFDRGASVLLTAFLFATIHLSPISFLHLFLVGLVCGHLRLRSGSIYPSILAHSGYNLAIVLIDWYWL